MKRVLQRVIVSVAGAICVTLLLANEAGASTFGREVERAATDIRSSRSNTLDRYNRPTVYFAGAPLFDRWLQAQLDRIRGEKSARSRARDLNELAASLERAAQPGLAPVPAQDPNAAASAILAQKKYQTSGAGPAPAPRESILEKILAWLGERLSDLITRIFGATAQNPIVGRVVAILYVVLVAVVAAYLIFMLVSLIARRRRPTPTDAGTPLSEALDPDAFYELAAAAAARGHYAQAVALVFRASLAVFDRSGKLPYDGSRTPGEYRRAVRRAIASVSSFFDVIAQMFVLAAFAEHPMSKDEFAAVDSAYQSLAHLRALEPNALAAKH